MNPPLAHSRTAPLVLCACSLLLTTAIGCPNDHAAPAGAPSASAASSAAAPSASAASSAAAAASAASSVKVEPAASSSAAPAAPGCPDLTNTEKVLAFVWERSFQVDAPLGAKLKGLSGAAAETRALSTEVDGELKQACLAIATQLGAKGPFAGGDVTCQAAVDALRAARTKLGPGAKIAVNVHAPTCPAPFDVMAECAKECGGGDKPEVKCEGGPVSGRCTSTCEGECDLRTASKCDGACEGRCDAGFSGACLGTCKGKCNGVALKAGSCAGKCEGTCEGFARGTCKGLCSGGCEGKTAQCPGLCVGKCSSALQEQKCNGTPKVASLGGECAAYCATRDVRKAICTPAIVNITVTGAKDTAASAQYEQVIERGLPGILRVEQRLKGRIEALARNQTVVSDGLKAVTTSGSPALSAFNSCLIDVAKAVTEGVTTLNEDFRAASLVATIAQGK